MTKSEQTRIEEAYALRDQSIDPWLYSPFNPSALYAAQQRERTMLNVMKKHGLEDLRHKKILDVGCGTGEVLQRFIGYGASPENLWGIDLLSGRIERAQSLRPGIDFRVANAEELPFSDEYFDIVLQFTMFTSILDDDMKRTVAAEMLRVLAPNGTILWYDYLLNNPRNPDVRGVGKQEIASLFTHCDITLKRVTLVPPLARLTVPLGWIGTMLLEKLFFLCTHYLGVISKSNTEL